MNQDTPLNLVDMLRQQAPQTTSGFPHVIERLARLWHDDKACRSFFHSLLVNTSPGQQGFPLVVMAELMHLHERYEAEYAEDRTSDAWSKNEPML